MKKPASIIHLMLYKPSFTKSARLERLYLNTQLGTGRMIEVVFDFIKINELQTPASKKTYSKLVEELQIDKYSASNAVSEFNLYIDDIVEMNDSAFYRILHELETNLPTPPIPDFLDARSVLNDIRDITGFSRVIGFHSMLSSLSYCCHNLKIESPLTPLRPNLLLMVLGQPSSGKGFFEGLFFKKIFEYEIESKKTIFFEAPTLAGMFSVFESGSKSCVICNEDAAAFLGNWQFQDARQNSTFAHLCRIYDTGTMRIQKADTNKSIHDIILSMSLGLQPKLFSAMTAGMKEQGIMSRFLVSLDQETRKNMTWIPTLNVDSIVSDFHSKASEVTSLYQSLSDGFIFPMNIYARSYYMEYINDELNLRQTSDLPVYTKIEKTLLKLVLIHAAFSGRTEANVNDVKSAIGVIQYYSQSIAQLNNDTSKTDKADLFEWLQAHVETEIPLRYILRNYINKSMRKTAIITPLLNELVADNLVTFHNKKITLVENHTPSNVPVVDEQYEEYLASEQEESLQMTQ